ncbi:hypothetical protein FB446DRAFT_653752 [Lentinula raphanica]|nr:hypothetical protein FB446DRAFT_653752 [Lentinula raphanica]
MAYGLGVHEHLIRHKQDHVYSYKSWRFEYGLQVKIFNHTSLHPSRKIAPSLCRLFMDAKSMAGTSHLIEMSSMPLPSFWRFEPGDQVIIHSDDFRRFGKVLSSVDHDIRNPACEVDVGGEICIVPVRDLEKEIILGHYIEVLAGVHLGRKGFVVGKSDTLLGICAGQDSTGLDFRVHANSVKLTVPDFSHTKIPWLDVEEVEVIIQSGRFVKCNGIVKNVRRNFRGGLCLSLWVPHYRCSIDIDYSAVCERW